ncbi:hypothetical protein GGR50DRAFT_121318 [Xylaria sp. CBS 124048]|nr:hypothetical protein GGR50DRAFT_121318 [Xylaria sp. CBS 124048]
MNLVLFTCVLWRTNGSVMDVIGLAFVHCLLSSSVTQLSRISQLIRLETPFGRRPATYFCSRHSTSSLRFGHPFLIFDSVGFRGG